ncbi:MAG: phospholipid/cholesterol/gamma-HCH transport system substrate-binding protein [Solirubrobacterales bacterium]|jgi:ABC-type transporter Mla subunit MlaD|nr:phospholipid/cholesterol/gamma-HCH transport system substrate-binding protein [Solirubrobacterales bacterium]
MPDVVAKTMAFICGALLVGTCAILYVTSRPQAGANEVVAEFQDAFPILEGMYVRVDGAIAGSVGTVEVTDNGLAEVTLILDESIEDPSSDATAAIRQQDTTGDSYVAFEPGDSGKPLPEVDGKPTIECGAETPESPCQATLTAPRFDDLLNAFGPAERSGVKLILLELSRALDERGDDVNAAALELRPAMVAANQALAEVNSQNAALRAVIEDAEDVTSQAASKRAELGGLIDSLETTLIATAEESASLDAGLDRLPETTTQAHSTMSALADASEAGIPLSEEVEASAPELASAIGAAPEFLDGAEVALDHAGPTLDLTRRLLKAGEPTIKADPTRVVTGAFDLAPAISNLLTGVLGDENTIKALFGDDGKGTDAGTLDRFGLGAVSNEPGNEPGYPASNVNRNMFRISAVFNCTMFGVPVEPDCLVNILGPRRSTAEAKKSGADGSKGEGGGGNGGGGGPPTPPSGGPDPKDPLGLNDILDDTLPNLPGIGNGGGNQGQKGPKKPDKAVQDLLDFLFKP